MDEQTSKQETTATEGGGTATATAPAPPSAADAGLKALEQEREARQKSDKELAGLRRQMKEMEAKANAKAQASVEERIAELEASRSKAEREAMAHRIAGSEGIPSDLIPFLQGKDEDEMKEQAARLKKFLAATADPKAPAPVGGQQGPPVKERSPEDWLEHMRKNRM